MKKYFLILLAVSLLTILVSCQSELEQAAEATVEVQQEKIDTFFDVAAAHVTVATQLAGGLPSEEFKADLILQDLEEINTRLNEAVELQADAKVAALESLAQLVETVRGNVEEAAEEAVDQLPEEAQDALSELQRELEELQGKIQDEIESVRQDLGQAVEEAADEAQAEAEKAVEEAEAKQQAEAVESAFCESIKVYQESLAALEATTAETTVEEFEQQYKTAEEAYVAMVEAAGDMKTAEVQAVQDAVAELEQAAQSVPDDATLGEAAGTILESVSDVREAAQQLDDAACVEMGGN